MTSETDAEFLDRLQPSWPGTNDSVRLPMADFTRLFALARRGAAMTPRPIEEAPKDREVIGVERPPGEDRNFYSMVKWDDDKNAWVTQVDIDWSVSPGRVVYAVCHGVSHFIHPDAVPLIPEEIVEASDDD